MLLVLQLGFYLSICRLASAAFVYEVTCRRVPAEPRRPVRFQNICMPVNRCFLSLYCIQQGVHSELMGTRFLF